MQRLRKLARISIPATVLALSGGAVAQRGNDVSTVPGLGDPRSVAQLPLGSIIESIPIEIAPGRRDFQPKLSLLYVSSFGTNDLGQGWDLEVGRIERSTQEGVPSLTPADAFTFRFAGSTAELVEVDAGLYRSQNESAFRQFFFFGDRWELLDNQGILYRFGTTSSSRVDDATWMLESIEDPLGNSITYSYLRDGERLYPTEIRYTGHTPSGDAGMNHVEFTYENRPDVTVSYRLGIRQERRLRIASIASFAGDDLVRRYVVDYGISPRSGRSLVDSVSLVGTDGVTTVVSREYEYRSRGAGWNTTPLSGAIPVVFNAEDGPDTGARLADVNSDGFVDVLANGEEVLLGDGAGGFLTAPQWSASLAATGVTFVDEDGLDTGGRILDVNSDGRQDLLVALPGRREVFLNTGAGWSFSEQWTDSLDDIVETGTAERRFFDPDCIPEDEAEEGEPTCEDIIVFTERFAVVEKDGDSKGVAFADVNADGRVDIIWSLVRTTVIFDALSVVPVHVQAVYLNTGDGWARDNDLSSEFDFPLVRDSRIQGYDVLDVNGDGLADVIRTAEGSDREVFLGTGAGWELDELFTFSLQTTEIFSIDEDRRNQGLMPLDFNDDGLVDYLRADESFVIAYRNVGTGWLVDLGMTANLLNIGITFADEEGFPAGALPADVDGNGVTDLLISKEGGSNAIHFSRGPVVDLMTQQTTGLGEQTTVEYAPSTQFDHTGDDDVHDLPVVLQVPISLTRSDGRGSTFTSTYSYEGGLFTERSFRGFRVAESVDPRGVTTRTLFHQDRERVGKVETDEIIDTAGRVRARKRLFYDFAHPAPGVVQVLTVRTVDQRVDPSGVATTQTRVVYDEFLNQLRVIKDGQPSVLGDETETTFEYVVDPDSGITSLPWRITVRDASAAILSQSTIFYDDLPAGNAVRGNATRVVDLLDTATGEQVERTFTYDAYGNVLTATDREGQQSEFEYDELTSSFRTRAIDPEGRVVQTLTDRRFGLPLRDIDASGNATTRGYDVFGRLVEVREPGDECSPQPTQQIVYSPIGDATSQSVTVHMTERPGEPGTFDTVTFFDGFAQGYRIEGESADGGTVAVITEFDDRGNATAMSRPFFSGQAPALARFEYGPLRRPTRIVEADGSALTVTYAGFTTERIDQRGNRARFVRDAFGNTVRVHQFVNGEENVTRFEYDALGRTTAVINALGEVTRITYDGLGRRTSLSDPAAGDFQYDYDRNGKLTRQTAPDGAVTRFHYNRSGDLVEKELPDGSSNLFFYGRGVAPNSVGRVVKAIDAAGTVELRYDPRGNVISRARTIKGERFVTGTFFDSMGRLTRATYPDGFVVDYQYNAAGYVERAVDGDGRPIVDDIEYTAAGQIVSMRYGNSVTSTYEYDSLARLTDIDTRNSAGDELQDLALTYDPIGNITALADGAFGRSQSFEYDALNRLVRAEGDYGVRTYEYDAIGNLLKKGNLVFGIDADRKQRVTCGIDLGLLESAANGITNNPHLSTCADALGDPSSGLRPEIRAAVGVIKARGVDNNPHVGQSFAVTYDELGNIIEKNGQRFTYDSENHLVRIEQPNGQLVAENTYDGAGIRVIQRTLDDTTYFIDQMFELNKSHAMRHVRVGSLLVATIATPRAQVELITDVGDDPLSLCASGEDAPNTDPGGCGVGLVSGARHSGPPLVLCVAVLLMLFRRRLSAAPRFAVAVGKSARHAARHPRKALVVLLLVPTYLAHAHVPAQAARPTRVSESAEKRFYYHSDHLGSTNVVSDERGAIIEERGYTPFGEQHVRTGAEGGPRQLEISYNGHRFDDSTGMYYFLARHYDPTLGRFLNADTVVPEPDNPMAHHRYAFNNNNPIRYVDPTGHGFLDIFKRALVWVILAVVVIAAIVVITVLTGGTGAFASAVIIGALIGAGIGAVVGVIAALAMGFSITSTEFWIMVSAGIILGAFVGAAAGAVSFLASTGLAGAVAAEKMASLVLIAGATGSLFGGISAAAVNGGFSNDFAMDFLLWGAAAAAGTALLGAFGTFAPVSFTVAVVTVVVLNALTAYSYCLQRGACSPVEANGSSTGGRLGNSLQSFGSFAAGGPLAGFGISAPGFAFLGTIVEQFRAIDFRSQSARRAPFRTMPLAP